jgi:cell wall-associated NlpC family hydrolase
MTGRGEAALAANPWMRWLRVVVAAVACASLLLILAAPAAQADPYPGYSEVRAAKAAVTKQKATVKELDAAIVRLEKAMEQAEIALYQAQEEYTTAQWTNVEAQRQLFAANGRADEAERALDDARADLAALAMMSYREGGTFGSLEAIMTADGFEDVIARSDALDRASRDAAMVVEQVRAAELVAQTMQRYAQEAAEEAVLAEAASHAAYDAAIEADRQAKLAFVETQETREEAITRLAQLRRTSSSLEYQRQVGLAKERQRKAAAEAARWAAIVAASGAYADSGGNATPFGGISVGTPQQAEVAVQYALAQVGEPYCYGMAGPDCWDCSGLTSTSWRIAGVSIPRTSRDQYNYVGKIPYGDMRRGDLIFWGTSTHYSSIYHVAMYIGNNQIVEASKPGSPNKVRDYRSWAVQNLMPFAGRP